MIAWTSARTMISSGPATPRLSISRRTSSVSPWIAATAASCRAGTAKTRPASSPTPARVMPISSRGGRLSTQALGQSGMPATSVVAPNCRPEDGTVADQDAAVAGAGDRRVEQRPGQHARVRAVTDADHDRDLAALCLVHRDRVGEAQGRGLAVGDRQRLALIGIDEDLFGVGVVGAQEDDRAVHQAEL